MRTGTRSDLDQFLESRNAGAAREHNPAGAGACIPGWHLQQDERSVSSMRAFTMLHNSAWICVRYPRLWPGPALRRVRGDVGVFALHALGDVKGRPSQCDVAGDLVAKLQAGRMCGRCCVLERRCRSCRRRCRPAHAHLLLVGRGLPLRWPALEDSRRSRVPPLMHLTRFGWMIRRQ